MLEIKNVTYSYHHNITALNDVSFSVEQGDCVCLAGANGSGKSTLLQLIATSIQPTTGDICFNQKSIYTDVAHTRRTIGMVFQNPDDQLFMPTVWEDVAYGVLTKGVTLKDAKRMALNALQQVEAEHLAERVPFKLSGGEKYRVAIASILVMEPQILIVDEPTASLDPKARKNIMQLLAQLDCTKLIATHDLDMAVTICNKICFLHNGQLVQSCLIPGLLHDEAFLQSIDLELPLSYTI